MLTSDYIKEKFRANLQFISFGGLYLVTDGDHCFNWKQVIILFSFSLMTRYKQQVVERENEKNKILAGPTKTIYIYDLYSAVSVLSV